MKIVLVQLCQNQNLKSHLPKSIYPYQSDLPLQLLFLLPLLKLVGPTTWLSPIVVVPKSSGKTCLCLDMQQANKVIIGEYHIIPKIKDILIELHGAYLKSTLLKATFK